MNTTVATLHGIVQPQRPDNCTDLIEAIQMADNHFKREAISHALCLGRYYTDLKAQAKKEGRTWQDVCNDTPYGTRHADRFIAIARNEALADKTHESQLPADANTLSTIAQLPPPEIEQHIQAGKISPTLSRAEAAQLVKGDTPKPKPAPKKTPPAPADGQPQSRGDGLRIAHQAIQILYGISHTDGLRLEAFQTVVDWIDTNTDGEVKKPAGNGGQQLLDTFKKAHPNWQRELVIRNLDWFRKMVEEVAQ